MRNALAAGHAGEKSLRTPEKALRIRSYPLSSNASPWPQKAQGYEKSDIRPQKPRSCQTVCMENLFVSALFPHYLGYGAFLPLHFVIFDAKRHISLCKSFPDPEKIGSKQMKFNH